MMDPEKLEELKDKKHVCEEDFVQEKKRTAARIMRADEPYSKNGIIYILLAWFLGMIGLHNFYAGYWKKGLTQLLLSIVSPWFLFIPTIFVALWVLGELLFVNKGANGINFGGNRKVIFILRGLAIVVLILAFSYSNLVFYNLDITTIEQNQ